MASKAGKGESPGAFPWDLESTRQRPEKITVSIGKTLSDIHHSRILYDPPPRILEISFCSPQSPSASSPPACGEQTFKVGAEAL